VRWEDESYVRVFTRDTPDLAAMGWEARAVMWEVFRKMDRAGILELGKSGRRGLSGLISIPLDVVNRAMDVLLEDGVLSMNGTTLFCKNFMAAQECTKSDKLRQKERRVRARDDEMSQNVTPPSQNVTIRHAKTESVTRGHEPSQDVTLCSAVLSSPSGSSALSASDPDPERAHVERLPQKCTCGATPEKCLTPSLCGTIEQEARSAPADRPCGLDLLTWFGRLRRDVLNVQNPPGSEVPKDTNGKASTFAASLTDAEIVDVKPTMRLALERIRDGVVGWNDQRNVDPSFAFGSWKSGFAGLRESIHGIAPKPAQAKSIDPTRGSFRATVGAVKKTGVLELP
jgi:hypothetical protein